MFLSSSNLVLKLLPKLFDLSVKISSDSLVFLDHFFDLSFLLGNSGFVSLLELLLLSLKFLNGLDVIADGLFELIDVSLEFHLGMLVLEELSSFFDVVLVAHVQQLILSVEDGVLEHDDLVVQLADLLIPGSDFLSSLLKLFLVLSLALENLFIIWDDIHESAGLDNLADDWNFFLLVNSAQVDNEWLFLAAFVCVLEKRGCIPFLFRSSFWYLLGSLDESLEFSDVAGNDFLRRALLLLEDFFNLLITDQSSLWKFFHFFSGLDNASTSNSLDLKLLEGNDLLSELGILGLKVVELFLVLSCLLCILLSSLLVVHYCNVSDKDLIESELLHLVLEDNLLLLNNGLFAGEVVDEVILFLHLLLFAHDLTLETFDLLLFRYLVEVVSETLDFVLQLHVLLLQIEGLSFKPIDLAIIVESILLGGLIQGNRLVGSLVNKVVWNNTLSDHSSLHQNVFVIVSIVAFNLLSDFVQLLISWISFIIALEIVDPSDVLVLKVISEGFKGLEFLQVNWIFATLGLASLGLLLSLRKELLQFSFSLGSVKSSSQRVELVHRFVLVLHHELNDRVFVLKDLLGLLLMLLDGVSEVSLTLLLEFLLLLAHVNGVLLVELNLLGSHKQWLKIGLLLSVVSFHIENVDVSGLSRCFLEVFELVSQILLKILRQGVVVELAHLLSEGTSGVVE